MSNNIDYIKEYNKVHYKRLEVYLTNEEMDAFKDALAKHNLTKSQFIKDAIKKLIDDKK